MAEARPPRVGDLFLALWRLSRPEAWMVSVLPLYVGHVLATRELVPGLAAWAAFWAKASGQGATAGEFWATLMAWLHAATPLMLAMLALGPLAWTATLLINDVHDLPADRSNPRKARSPLVQGIVSAGWAHRAAYVFAVLAVGVGLAVNWRFALLVAACLALAWLYSVPPVRLKTRPGSDLAVNALGIGLLSGVAGWSITASPASFPWPFAPQGLLVAAAIYVPTTLVDHDADLRAGYSTLATHLGPRRAYLVGWWSWVLCNVGALALSWNGLYIPRAMFPLLLIFVPLLLFEYHQLIGRATSSVERVKGIFVCSATFLAVNLVFALMYTGLWKPG
jgi:4-hydroxybenzoate polyprenyltransferase